MRDSPSACESSSSASTRGESTPLRSRYSAAARRTSPSVIDDAASPALERPPLLVGGERVGERLEVAGEHVGEAVVHAGAVVGHAVLRIVVGADLLGARARADLREPRRRLLGLLPLALGLEEAGTQHA